jgi:hypothetical protein
MKPRSADYVHLLRMAGLFALGITAFLVLRWAMVPAGFGVYGHYRAGALDDNRDAVAHPIRFAGQATCIACHDEQAAVRAKGRHARVACESCHGALAAHAEAPDKVKPVKPDPRKTCVTCHTKSISKPKTFPQVDPADHAPDGPCTACHEQPHSPKIAGGA